MSGVNRMKTSDDQWMEQTKGGNRASAYSAPRKKKKPRSALQRFKDSAAKFQDARFERLTK